MIRISNVSVTISNANNSYEPAKDGEEMVLSISVKSDSREFLERISEAVHRELSDPDNVRPSEAPINIGLPASTEEGKSILIKREERGVRVNYWPENGGVTS